MAQLSVSMPPALQDWVDTRLADGNYTDASDYLRDLVRRDRERYRGDVDRVRALIDDGIASGIVDAEPEDILDGIIDGIRRPHG